MSITMKHYPINNKTKLTLQAVYEQFDGLEQVIGELANHHDDEPQVHDEDDFQSFLNELNNLKNEVEGRLITTYSFDQSS